jgi:hypothetical protein
MLSRLAASLALCAGLAVSPAYADCKISDIRIKNWQWRIESGYIVLVGEFVNNCTQPTSVRFQMVVRDAAGKVVDDEDFSSAGEDVPSGEASAFKGMEQALPKGKNVELKIIEVFNRS